MAELGYNDIFSSYLVFVFPKEPKKVRNIDKEKWEKIKNVLKDKNVLKEIGLEDGDSWEDIFDSSKGRLTQFKEKLEKVKNVLKEIGLEDWDSLERIVDYSQGVITLFTEELEKVKNVLKEIGLEDLDSLERIVDNSKGVFIQLKEMGVTEVYFRDSKQEEIAKLKLEPHYLFIPDFSFRIPDLRRESLSKDKISTPPEFPWPPKSGIKKAHASGKKGAGVMIGVLDTGVEADHPEFQFPDKRHIKFRYFSTIRNSIAPYRDVRGFDIHGHGTQVCGVIAGKNIGIAPEAELYVGAVIGNGIETSFSRVLNGLEWLLEEFGKPQNQRKLKIINMSIRFTESKLREVWETDIQFRTILNELKERIELIEQKNILLVAAIGNEGTGNVTYPGAFDEVLGVGAVDINNQIWDNSGSSEEHSKPDVVGYGVNISSCIERDYDGNPIYQENSGTSIASAYVTGVAALYWSQNKSLTAEEVRKKISTITLNQIANQSANRFGRGLVVYKPDSESVV